MKDNIVESVLEKFKQRSEEGIKKYGVTMDRKDLSGLEWLTHLQEELMDATLYIEKLKKRTMTEMDLKEKLIHKIELLILEHEYTNYRIMAEELSELILDEMININNMSKADKDYLAHLSVNKMKQLIS